MYRVDVIHVQSGHDRVEVIHVQSGGDSCTEWR